ncbi:nuclear transport factor 2 family protein [Parafrankia sp. EUN1f]|uniref:nuclear transport factor 2 family protein n=1 Tax=Parafrankia sp. EUN1f TaxID=102897 RepID=UPI0001C441DF|nr:nuclear transport factor 2 family protein [Parafrankia sp. EUN1f]EFC86058.1 hypothetical protein FrEUN1fDRAFT_0848 [Parafrankia sp. EUN1f]
MLRPPMLLAALLGTLVAAALSSCAGASGSAEEESGRRAAATHSTPGQAAGTPEGQTEAVEQRTLDFFRAMERRETATMEAMLAPDATWRVAMSFSGDRADQSYFGDRAAALANLRQISTMVSTVRFVDTRVSVTGDGATSFMQANGDFVTAAGKPYRNTYVFRLDWREDLITQVEEYTNPITICASFGLPLCVPGVPDDSGAQQSPAAG